jgi:dTDP-4-dehydrorhamnose 3,5-epimerase
MKFIPTPLKGAFLIEPEPITDSRGWFSRVFDKNEFDSIGFSGKWMQCNNSFTAKKGSLRGMHFQYPPHSEQKLVR